MYTHVYTNSYTYIFRGVGLILVLCSFFVFSSFSRYTHISCMYIYVYIHIFSRAMGGFNVCENAFDSIDRSILS